MFMLIFILLVLVSGGGLSFPLNFLLVADLVAAIAWRKWGYGNLSR